jgi:hypothetical protein
MAGLVSRIHPWATRSVTASLVSNPDEHCVLVSLVCS